MIKRGNKLFVLLIMLFMMISLTACGLTERLNKMRQEKCPHYENEYETTVEPTCEEEGEETITCYECGYIRTEPLRKLEHSYTSEETVAPTCGAEGIRTYTCTGCEDSYTKFIPKLTIHTEVIDKAVEATTSSTGLTEGKHCSVCGTVLVAQQVIPKKELTAAQKSSLKIIGSGGSYNYEAYSISKVEVVNYTITDRQYLDGIEIEVNVIQTMTWAKDDWKWSKVAWELYDSNGICVKNSNLLVDASVGTKYSEKISLSVPTGAYTLKFMDVK